MRKLHFAPWDKDSNEQPLKQLSRLYDEKRRLRRPRIPEYAMERKPVFREGTANDLTKTIISFMEIIGGQAERINSMGRQITRNRRTTWVYGTGTNGTADISATYYGVSIKIEVKIGKDRQSEVQKQYQSQIEQAGGIYVLAKTFDGFLYGFFKAMEGRKS